MLSPPRDAFCPSVHIPREIKELVIILASPFLCASPHCSSPASPDSTMVPRWWLQSRRSNWKVTCRWVWASLSLGSLGRTEGPPEPWDQLTCAEFACKALCQLAPLAQLLTEVLFHVAVNSIPAKELLKGFHRITDMLHEKGRESSSHPHLLPQVG